MQQSGNLWQQMWEDAIPKPIHKQARLFDYVTQAEKVPNSTHSNIDEQQRAHPSYNSIHLYDRFFTISKQCQR